MSASVWWWTCRAPVCRWLESGSWQYLCLDRMAPGPREQVERDQAAHLATHPGWQPAAGDLVISHWP